MKNKIGKEVYTLGKRKWSRMKWGEIIGIADANHYLVRYADGRTAWIHKTKEILSTR